LGGGEREKEKTGKRACLENGHTCKRKWEKRAGEVKERGGGGPQPIEDPGTLSRVGCK